MDWRVHASFPQTKALAEDTMRSDRFRGVPGFSVLALTVLGAGGQVTVEDLKALGSTAGFDMSIESTCTRRPTVGDSGAPLP